MTIFSREVLELGRRYSPSPAERQLIDSHLEALEEIRLLRGGMSDMLAALDAIDGKHWDDAVKHVEAMQRKNLGAMQRNTKQERER